MKKTDNRKFWKILVFILKIVLAIPAVLLFTLIRCLQFFLKVCGTVVSFVCILSAVVISMGRWWRFCCRFVEMVREFRQLSLPWLWQEDCFMCRQQEWLWSW